MTVRVPADDPSLARRSRRRCPGYRWRSVSTATMAPVASDLDVQVEQPVRDARDEVGRVGPEGDALARRARRRRSSDRPPLAPTPPAETSTWHRRSQPGGVRHECACGGPGAASTILSTKTPLRPATTRTWTLPEPLTATVREPDPLGRGRERSCAPCHRRRICDLPATRADLEGDRPAGSRRLRPGRSVAPFFVAFDRVFLIGLRGLHRPSSRSSAPASGRRPSSRPHGPTVRRTGRAGRRRQPDEHEGRLRAGQRGERHLTIILNSSENGSHEAARPARPPAARSP